MFFSVLRQSRCLMVLVTDQTSHDAGTLLMTEERQKAIWAIYGKGVNSYSLLIDFVLTAVE